MKCFILCISFCTILACDCVAQPTSVSGFKKEWGNTDEKKPKWRMGIVGPDKQPAVPFGTYTYAEIYSGDIFIVGKGTLDFSGIPKVFGLFDAAGRKEIQPVTAKSIEPFKGCFSAVLDENGRHGFLDAAGQDISGRYLVNYRGFVSVERGTAARYAVMGKCGKPLTPFHYTNHREFSGGYAPVQRNGFYTIVDSMGKELFEPKYLYLSSFSGGVAAFANSGEFKNGFFISRDWGFIDATGKELGTQRYEDIDDPYGQFTLKNGRINVKLQGKWVSLDPLANQNGTASGAVVSKPVLEAFQADNKKALWGYRVKGGDVMIKPQFTAAEPFINGRAYVQRLEVYSKYSKIPQWGVIDDEGTVIIPLDHGFIERYNKDFYKVGIQSKDMQYGLIESMGKQLIPKDYIRFGELKEGLIAVTDKEGKSGYINLKGEYIISPLYSSTSEFSEGLATVQDLQGKWGLINKKGEYVIQPVYKKALVFSEGLAVVTTDEKKWYWVDTKDRTFLRDRNYIYATAFINGKADVWTKTDQWGRADGKMTIDGSGKLLQEYALNAPPKTIEYEIECFYCRGHGKRYEPVTRTTTTTDVDNYSVYAPGGKVITTRTKTKTDYVEVGKCMYCNGTGRQKGTRLQY